MNTGKVDEALAELEAVLKLRPEDVRMRLPAAISTARFAIARLRTPAPSAPTSGEPVVTNAWKAGYDCGFEDAKAGRPSVFVRPKGALHMCDSKNTPIPHPAEAAPQSGRAPQAAAPAVVRWQHTWDFCPNCGDSLDTGNECVTCGFDLGES